MSQGCSALSMRRLWPPAVMASQQKKHLLNPNCPKHHVFHPKGKAERCGSPQILHFLIEERGLAGSEEREKERSEEQ